MKAETYHGRCPYCGGAIRLVDSIRIYQHRSYGYAWICENYPECDTYVGCHKDSSAPLGQVANKELRDWRMAAHGAFDKLWKSPTRRMTRKQAYRIMQEILHINKDQAHIGLFFKEQCQELIRALEWKYPELYSTEEDISPKHEQED